MSPKRENFNSKLGLLLAIVGSAVGLGNMWRFPYLLGSNGGSAFLIIYLVLVFILCTPITLAEYYVGRKTKKDCFRAFDDILKPGPGRIFGSILCFSAFFTISYYIVVGGPIISYFFGCFNFNTFFSADNIKHFENVAMGMGGTPASALQSTITAILFLAISAVVLCGGVVKGIEKFSKITMPVLFFLILFVAIYSCSLDGAEEGIKYLLKPDFSKVTGSTFSNALGQAFMSLSLGCGTLMTYASYSQKDSNSVRTSLLTIILDSCFAIISGLAIIPAVFAFGMVPGQGPELLFNTLPRIFTLMKGGSLVAVLFFFTVFIAALSSAISLMEVLISVVTGSGKVSRGRAVLYVTAATIITGTLCCLSFGPLNGIKLPGGTIFDFFNITSTNIFMTLGSLGLVLLVGWKLGKKDFKSVLADKTPLGSSDVFFNIMFFIVRWVAPIVIVTIMVLGFINN